MTASVRVVRSVCDADEFNALRHRLPRAARRSVNPAPAGHVGLIVQIVSGDDRTLTTVWSHLPAGVDPAGELSRLEDTARARLR